MFVNKSKDEYNKLLSQYQDEDEKFKKEIDNLKILHS